MPHTNTYAIDRISSCFEGACAVRMLYSLERIATAVFLKKSHRNFYPETKPQVKLLMEETAKKRKEEEAASYLLKVTMDRKEQGGNQFELTRRKQLVCPKLVRGEGQYFSFFREPRRTGTGVIPAKRFTFLGRIRGRIQSSKCSDLSRGCFD